MGSCLYNATPHRQCIPSTWGLFRLPKIDTRTSFFSSVAGFLFYLQIRAMCEERFEKKAKPIGKGPKWRFWYVCGTYGKAMLNLPNSMIFDLIIILYKFPSNLNGHEALHEIYRYTTLLFQLGYLQFSVMFLFGNGFFQFS